MTTVLERNCQRHLWLLLCAEQSLASQCGCKLCVTQGVVLQW